MEKEMYCKFYELYDQFAIAAGKVAFLYDYLTK
jgi:hypothetical protein